MECTQPESVFFNFLSENPIKEMRISQDGAGVYLVEGFLPASDKRDPDPFFPVIIGIRILHGTCRSHDASGFPLLFTPDSTGKLAVAFSINMLDASQEKILASLQEAPLTVEEGHSLTYQWLKKAMGNLYCFDGSEKEAQVLAKAAYALAFNACEAPGLLNGRISCFPNRGRYPAHYLWDSCFQSLALEYMDPCLAEDSLLLLTENMRVDGKIGHFVCSTWIRPQETQPPLIGWAGLQLVKNRNSCELAKQLLYPLVKNTKWWLVQRMTRFGLVCSHHPVETGWDNTPRFDQGPVLPCDMNSYILLQMRACEEFARMLGDEKTEVEMKSMADGFSQKMVEVLYDQEDNLFYDVLLETGKRLHLKTPACFMPLLAGVPLDECQIRGMIEKHLLDPDSFFGAIPFPSVAYGEESYNPGQWWRGPTWMPVAYLMLELLKKYRYTSAYHEAKKRLYHMIIQDGKLSELFHSKTGEGLGSSQQGWTAAILLKLKMEE